MLLQRRQPGQRHPQRRAGPVQAAVGHLAQMPYHLVVHPGVVQPGPHQLQLRCDVPPYGLQIAPLRPLDGLPAGRVQRVEPAALQRLQIHLRQHQQDHREAVGAVAQLGHRELVLHVLRLQGVHRDDEQHAVRAAHAVGYRLHPLLPGHQRLPVHDDRGAALRAQQLLHGTPRGPATARAVQGFAATEEDMGTGHGAPR